MGDIVLDENTEKMWGGFYTGNFRIKPLEEMDLIDDFLNNAVASNRDIGEEIFRTILEVLLNKKIGPVTIQNQVVLSPVSPELRGVRLDVEIRENNENKVTIYDYEPHTARDMDFALSNRYRQAMIDSKCMRSGDFNFSHMPELYIVTITNFDIFGENSMVYTVRNRIQEFREIDYEDRLKFIYFNTKGTVNGSKAIKNMLTYIQKSDSSNAVDDATAKVDSLVTRIKNLEEVRSGYMTYGEKIKIMVDKMVEKDKDELMAKGRAEEHKITLIEKERADRAEAERDKAIAELEQLKAEMNKN